MSFYYSFKKIDNFTKKPNSKVSREKLQKGRKVESQSRTIDFKHYKTETMGVAIGNAQLKKKSLENKKLKFYV